jgi:hypothetical protein
MGWDILLSLVKVIAFVSFTMGHAYNEGPVTSQRVRAAVAAYLLIRFRLYPGLLSYPRGLQVPG